MTTELDLYQDAIKLMAAANHGHGQLQHATSEARLTNPLCGDRVRMQVRVAAGRIEAVAHETRGCLLCRAASSLLGARAIGLDAAAVADATSALESVLGHGDAPAPTWPELEIFRPAHSHPSRHKCALLPFRALQAAMKTATHDLP